MAELEKPEEQNENPINEECVSNNSEKILKEEQAF